MLHVVFVCDLQIAFPSCPMAEFLMLAPNANVIQPLFGDLFVDEPLPKNGYIELDDSKYGFGVTLNPNLKLKRPYVHDAKTLAETLEFKSSTANENLIGDQWLKKHSLGPAKLRSNM